MAQGYVAVVVLIGWRFGEVLARGTRRLGAMSRRGVLPRRGRRIPSYGLVLSDRGPMGTLPIETMGSTPAAVRRTARMRGHQDLAKAVQRTWQPLRLAGPGRSS